MSVFLLDVNVLVALAWRGHRLHEQAQRWFLRKGSHAWATCPFTQAGFVRILSNPAFSAKAVPPREAINALQTSIKHPGHQFWTDNISLPEAVTPFGRGLLGHQQVTDACLLGLAVRKKESLATLDSGVLALLEESRAPRTSVELIS
jgi:uncharacterized protein